MRPKCKPIRTHRIVKVSPLYRLAKYIRVVGRVLTAVDCRSGAKIRNTSKVIETSVGLFTPNTPSTTSAVRSNHTKTAMKGLDVSLSFVVGGANAPHLVENTLLSVLKSASPEVINEIHVIIPEDFDFRYAQRFLGDTEYSLVHWSTYPEFNESELLNGLTGEYVVRLSAGDILPAGKGQSLGDELKLSGSLFASLGNCPHGIASVKTKAAYSLTLEQNPEAVVQFQQASIMQTEALKRALKSGTRFWEDSAAATAHKQGYQIAVLPERISRIPGSQTFYEIALPLGLQTTDMELQDRLNQGVGAVGVYGWDRHIALVITALQVAAKFDGLGSRLSFIYPVIKLIDQIPAIAYRNSRLIPSRNAEAFIASAAMTRAPFNLHGREVVLPNQEVLFDISQLYLSIRALDFGAESLTLDVLFYDYGLGNISAHFVSDEGQKAQIAMTSILEGPHDAKFAGLKLSKSHHVQFRVPYGQRTAKWHFEFKHQALTPVRATRPRMGPVTPFAFGDGNQKHTEKEHWIRWHQDELIVAKAKTHFWAYKLYTTLRLLFKERHFNPARLFATLSKTEIVLTDRPAFGDDNAEALFRYIHANKPDLSPHTWIVLAPTARAYKELSKTHRVVKPGSFRHKMVLFRAKIFASTHLLRAFNFPYKERFLRANRDLLDPTFIWLQHGVTMNKISGALSRLNEGTNGVVVAAHHEEAMVKDPRHYLHDQQVLRTGFPRFDVLTNNAERTILFMPTWRRWLTGQYQADGTHAPIPDIENTQYFKGVHDLLTDRRLLEALETHRYRLSFVPHPGVLQYYKEFEQLTSKVVTMVEASEVPYRTHFAQGAALVTDYSSVFWDFAYLGKPVLFYQFDKSRFFSDHYQAGSFDYAEQAPGEIFEKVDELVDRLIAGMQNGSWLLDGDTSDISKLLIHHDKKNSARLSRALLEAHSFRREGTRKP